VKDYVLANWQKYNMVDSKEEMLKLINVLQAHNETLDSLHDVTIGNRNEICGIYITSSPQTDREVKEIIFEHNCFYSDMDEVREALKEIAEDYEVSIESLLKTEDIRKTDDGFVRVLEF